MRGGHIPGAVNVPFGKLVSADDYSVRAYIRIVFKLCCQYHKYDG